MLQQIRQSRLDDIFLELGKRPTRGVYFTRISGYNSEVHDFLVRYYETARLSGVVLEGLPNPDNNNLGYYNEIMGMNFQLSPGFIDSSLRKWLPRMSPAQRSNVAGAIYDILINLKRSGKNDNMLKNAYIKFMCWLYYKFERIIHQLGAEKLPKILYEGNLGIYQLLLLQVLCSAGCDIVLLEYQGDGDYQKVDPSSERSSLFSLPDAQPFPAGFSLKKLRQQMQEAANNERLYGPKPKYDPCTNAWCSGDVFADLRKSAPERGEDPRFYYNAFIRIQGVEDRLSYPMTLYQLQQDLKAAKRNLVIVSNQIPAPTPEEINGIRRKTCPNLTQLIQELSVNVRHPSSQELQRIMMRAFVDLMLEEGKKDGGNLNRLTNRAVYLLCWLKRYQLVLFPRWNPPESAAFFYFGACQNANEALFLRYLARLPVDVVLFVPNREANSCVEDRLLYTVNYEQSLNLAEYPDENSNLQVSTAAHQAERDLDTLLYQDSGIYRNQQYGKANSITLHTMYEEIAILWKEEVTVRPGFATSQEVVSIPVLYAKVSGVKDGRVQDYWSSINQLVTSDTFVIQTIPHITSATQNPIRSYAPEFLRNGKLQKGKIKAHRAYPYGFLRESMQDHLLDKIQALIDQKTIKGTFENGTEYTIVSVALNLEKEVLRMVQSFDFTKKNPKLIYIITAETQLSLEDTIYAAFLNLVGFDVLFFVPTGYQSVERFYQRNLPEEHQIGEYIYDLRSPTFSAGPSQPRQSWRDIFFRRGR